LRRRTSAAIASRPRRRTATILASCTTHC